MLKAQHKTNKGEMGEDSKMTKEFLRSMEPMNRHIKELPGKRVKYAVSGAAENVMTASLIAGMCADAEVHPCKFSC